MRTLGRVIVVVTCLEVSGSPCLLWPQSVAVAATRARLPNVRLRQCALWLNMEDPRNRFAGHWRGFECADGVGFVQIRGVVVPNTTYVYCTKRIAGDFACAYRVVATFLKREEPSDISTNSQRVCL
jgi:hypothetical protein